MHVAHSQVDDRDGRLVKAEALLRAKLAAKDQELEAAKVWHTGHRAFACFVDSRPPFLHVSWIFGQAYFYQFNHVVEAGQ